MSLDTDLLRSQIVAEAFTWLRTPYHHQARIKGVGVDCVWLLIEVYKSVGLVAPDFDPGNYEGEWYFHQSEEIYLAGVIKHAHEVKTPQLGDVALYNFGKCVSHGVIIVGVPQQSPGGIGGPQSTGELMGIHAHRPSRNVELIELRTLADRFESYWSAV
jgi:cell wall-associated NlpC family hydrolase